MVELTEEIRRLVGQCFVFGFEGHDVSQDFNTLITKHYLGNVILMKRNVRDIEQVHGLVQTLQKLAKDAGHERPLMIGTDQENGLVSAFSSPTCGTLFPGAMALAATASTELAQRVTFASASEMKMAGLNWAYSPVADVNSDPRNPVIGVRSFGDDPSKVSDFVEAVSNGLTLGGIAPSAKHFPGHGNTHVDSHLSLPRIMQSKDALTQTELVPFQRLVDGNVASIMTGHMALPLVTGDDTPCSLSHVITTRLLREEMGYTGLVVTDCLEMEAVAEKYGAEGGAVMALEAGADVVMICHRMDRQLGALERAYDAVRAGRLSVDALREKSRRVSALKDAFAGSWDAVLSTPFDAERWARLKAKHASLSAEAYAAAVSVVHDSDGVLPIVAGAGAIVVFTPAMESVNLAVDDADGVLRDGAGRLRNTAGPSYTAFAAFLARRTTVHHIVYSREAQVSENDLESLRDAAAVVFATRNGFDTGAWQVQCLKKIVEEVGAPKKLVVVSTCAPYDVLGLSLGVPAAVLATMEFSTTALETAGGVIFGDTVAGGAVPVTIN